MYNEETDSVYDILNTYLFEENATFGNASNPEFLSNNFRPTSISYSNLNLTDQSINGDTLAMLEVEADGITDYNFQLLGNDFDNNMFQIENEFLVLAENIDFANQSTFTILVEAFDGNGCNIDSLFELSAINTNEPPTDIFFINDENSIDENLPEGSEVGLFDAEDSTPDDLFTFELLGDTLDNNTFEIEGNTLLSTQVFDYETKNEYEIFVKVTDESGNTFEKVLQVIIIDLIEFDDLKAGNLVTPNADGFNDFFEVPNVFLYTNYTLSIYNENGNLLFSSNSYANNWAGTTNNGKELPSGTYYYSFKNENSEEGFTGVLYLIRD
jgi:gliding motility-associated-like protein